MSDKPKEETKEKKTKINIKINGFDGSSQTFLVNKEKPFKRLLDVYADIKKLDISLIRFHFEGDRIHPNSTPLSMKMEDNDTIDVSADQDGGSSVEQS